MVSLLWRCDIFETVVHVLTEWILVVLLLNIKLKQTLLIKTQVWTKCYIFIPIYIYLGWVPYKHTGGIKIRWCNPYYLWGELTRFSGETLVCRPRDSEFDPPHPLHQPTLLTGNIYWFFPGKVLQCISAIHWSRYKPSVSCMVRASVSCTMGRCIETREFPLDSL